MKVHQMKPYCVQISSKSTERKHFWTCQLIWFFAQKSGFPPLKPPRFGKRKKRTTRPLGTCIPPGVEGLSETQRKQGLHCELREAKPTAFGRGGSWSWWTAVGGWIGGDGKCTDKTMDHTMWKTSICSRTYLFLLFSTHNQPGIFATYLTHILPTTSHFLANVWLTTPKTWLMSWMFSSSAASCVRSSTAWGRSSVKVALARSTKWITRCRVFFWFFCLVLLVWYNFSSLVF